jgi:serine/threonine protein kinase
VIDGAGAKKLLDDESAVPGVPEHTGRADSVLLSKDESVTVYGQEVSMTSQVTSSEKQEAKGDKLNDTDVSSTNLDSSSPSSAASSKPVSSCIFSSHGTISSIGSSSSSSSPSSSSTASSVDSNQLSFGPLLFPKPPSLAIPNKFIDAKTPSSSLPPTLTAAIKELERHPQRPLFCPLPPLPQAYNGLTFAEVGIRQVHTIDDSPPYSCIHILAHIKNTFSFYYTPPHLQVEPTLIFDAKANIRAIACMQETFVEWKHQRMEFLKKRSAFMQTVFVNNVAYKLLTLLGQGSYGAVYRAMNMETGEMVCIERFSIHKGY